MKNRRRNEQLPPRRAAAATWLPPSQRWCQKHSRMLQPLNAESAFQAMSKQGESLKTFWNIRGISDAGWVSGLLYWCGYGTGGMITKVRGWRVQGHRMLEEPASSATMATAGDEQARNTPDVTKRIGTHLIKRTGHEHTRCDLPDRNTPNVTCRIGTHLM